MRAQLRKQIGSILALVGASRHSALPLVRAKVEPTVRTVGLRATALLIGSLLIGTAVGFLVEADRGLAPYDVLSDGLAGKLGISLGQAGWLVAGVLFAVASLLGRRPSPWGMGYILANGLAIDATSELLNGPSSTLGQVVYVGSAIAIMALGINVVLFSGTTGGPFELLMHAGEDRGVDRTHVRYVLDVGVLVIGLLIGGSFGFATIVYAALMGLVLEGIRQVFADYDTGRRVRLEAGQPA